MENKITGILTQIQQAECLLIEGREVEQIAFGISAKGEIHRFVAASDDGTAFHTLETDTRFRRGVSVICRHHGRICVSLRLDVPWQHGKAVETDIARLKDKAMRHLHLPKGELYALLSAFDKDSPQAYAIAKFLKQQGERTAQVLSVADQDAVCSVCKRTLHVSPHRAYVFSDAFCSECRKNVAFDLKAPMPRDEPEPPPSLQEIQARLKERFGR